MELPRPYPRPDRDTAPFWEAQRNHELRLQRCFGCGAFRFPVTPLCPECRSFDFEWALCSGLGIVYSYAAVQHQTHPAFSVPYTILLVEMEEARASSRSCARPMGLRSASACRYASSGKTTLSSRCLCL